MIFPRTIDRSNGAPKKITKLFEEYIRPLPPQEETDAWEKIFDDSIVVGVNSNNLYLHFGYYQQYIFGFSSYLFSPFLLSVSKYLKDFGDKLLVSTAFILNHLYKFHGTGFSYRTLELTPEIIAINKAPELRPFIENLIQFLSNIHIREILTGLHQFKFHSKIEKEISFISSISEKESAAYNFTLDESLEIKKIYRQRLDRVRNTYKSDGGFTKHIHSISYLNLILGDLYYHDQEYDDAVLHYSDATLLMRSMKTEDFDLDSIVFFIRSQLKLGMIYEKKRKYDDALFFYENLKNRIRGFLQKDKNRQSELFNKSNTSWVDYEMLPALRLLYQPFIAELQLIEKHTIKAITKHYIRVNVTQFKHIVEKLKPEQRFLIKAEYYDKIGDILYYKNGLNFGERLEKDNGFSKSSKYDSFIELQQKHLQNHPKPLSLPISAYKYYMRSLNIILLLGVKEIFNKELLDKGVSLFQFEAIKKSEIRILHVATELLMKSTQKAFPLKRKNLLTTLGNSLSDAGDCMLCFVDHDKDLADNKIGVENLEAILKMNMNDVDFKTQNPLFRLQSDDFNNEDFTKEFFDKLLKERTTPILGKYEKFSRIELTIRYVYVAALCFLQADEYKEYAFQLTKILHIIKFNLINIDCPDDDKKKDLLKTLHDKLVSRIIRNIYRAYGNTNHTEYEKLKNIFEGSETFKSS